MRKHRFDPARVSAKWKEKDIEKFISMISDRVEARTDQGKAFRHYDSQSRDKAPIAQAEEKEAEQQHAKPESPSEQTKEGGAGSPKAKSKPPEAADSSSAAARSEPEGEPKGEPKSNGPDSSS